MIGVACGQPLADGVGEDMDLLEAGRNADRHDDVQPPRAGRLDEGDEFQLFEQCLEAKGRPADEAEVLI